MNNEVPNTNINPNINTNINNQAAPQPMPPQPPAQVMPTQQPTQQQNILNQPPQPIQQTTPPPIPPTPPQNIPDGKSKRVKKKNRLARFFFVIILILIGYIVYTQYTNKLQIEKLNYECTPVSTTKGEKELELDSTIVQDLYNKVSTNIREDLSSTTLDDSMKLYLAFRQIPNKKIYESNCNLFSKTAMEPYTCVENSTFTPTAFKEETLQTELKTLFGENTNITNANIRLGNGCIGGYQYIAERGEYVSGYCQNENSTQYTVSKKLIRATSNQSTITLKEEVKYYGAEKLELPENLRSGIYAYTFRLDTNYNYVYISKTFEE